jgi:hypothetical protein
MKWLKKIFRKIFNKKSKMPKYVDLGNGRIRLKGTLRSDCKSIIYVNHTETIHLLAIRHKGGDCSGCIFFSNGMCSSRVHIGYGYMVRPCTPIGDVKEFHKLVRSSDLLEEI